jgi:uncharacterized membrane protein YbhN (UPF0104 family)
MSLLKRYGVRVLISTTLVVYLFLKVDPNEISNQLREVNWALLLVVTPLIHCFCTALRSLRLKVILHSMGLGVSAWWLSVAQLKGAFVGTFLPGGISGDLYRTYVVSTKTGRGYESVVAVFVEKALGVGSMLCLATGSLLWGAYLMQNPALVELEQSLRWLWGGLLATAILLSLALYTGSVSHIRLPGKWWPQLRNVLVQSLDYFGNGKPLFEMALFSLLIQVAVVVWYFTISTAVAFDLSLLVLVLTVPIIELLLMLPISVSGIGVREVAFVVLLTPFGLTVADAVSFALLCFTVATCTKVVSGIAFLIESGNRRVGG